MSSISDERLLLAMAAEEKGLSTFRDSEVLQLLLDCLGTNLECAATPTPPNSNMKHPSHSPWPPLASNSQQKN